MIQHFGGNITLKDTVCNRNEALGSDFKKTRAGSYVLRLQQLRLLLGVYHFNVFSLQVFLTVVLFLPQSQKLLLLLVSQLLEALVFLAT